MTVSETLRTAVETCGQTRYRIAQETGINESTMSRFVASGRGLSMDNCDRLCVYLGLELKVKRGKTRKGR
ncbi:MAG: helix-turn-helix transcriptional regulator [Planctomycetes bacterium]|nr:helix-turn-helix transcriptional regulator [Planctomycetota bacterium]